METTWRDLDVDSLDLVELVRILEDRYDVRIADEKLEGVGSVGDAVRLIAELRETGHGMTEVVVTGRGVVSSIHEGPGADAFLDALEHRTSGVADGVGALRGLRPDHRDDAQGGAARRPLHPAGGRRRRAGGRGGRRRPATWSPSASGSWWAPASAAWRRWSARRSPGTSAATASRLAALRADDDAQRRRGLGGHAARRARPGVLGLASACATGGHAIGEALRMIERGEADVVVAGGTEAALIGVCLAAFRADGRAVEARGVLPVRRAPRRLRDGRGRGRARARARRPRPGAGRHRLRAAGGLRRLQRRVPHHPARRGRPRAPCRRCARRSRTRARRRPTSATSTPTAPRRPTTTGSRRRRSTPSATATRRRSPRTKSAIGHLLGAAGAVEAVATLGAARARRAPAHAQLRGARPRVRPRLRARRPARGARPGARPVQLVRVRRPERVPGLRRGMRRRQRIGERGARERPPNRRSRSPGPGWSCCATPGTFRPDAHRGRRRRDRRVRARRRAAGVRLGAGRHAPGGSLGAAGGETIARTIRMRGRRRVRRSSGFPHSGGARLQEGVGGADRLRGDLPRAGAGATCRRSPSSAGRARAAPPTRPRSATSTVMAGPEARMFLTGPADRRARDARARRRPRSSAARRCTRRNGVAAPGGAPTTSTAADLVRDAARAPARARGRRAAARAAAPSRGPATPARVVPAEHAPGLRRARRHRRGSSTAAPCSSSAPRWARNLVVGLARIDGTPGRA